ncbi:hypothetical protein B0T09DRAFT_396489 [Sordaria sp. MPI-SDFR-AT-0083]|nr:hypothetical protein B0T09DRAFT_396489 [Sordaria sp. MPI-SDFR-AT-0083]
MTMRQLSFKRTPTATATTKHHATTTTKTSTKTATLLGFGLLMAAPGFWVAQVHAAPNPGISLNNAVSVLANHNNKLLEAKRHIHGVEDVVVDRSSSMVAKKDDNDNNNSDKRKDVAGDDNEADPWLMPIDKFNDNYLDPYWAKRNQSAVHGRSSLVGMSRMVHGKRTAPVYDSALYCGIFATGYMEDTSALLLDFKKKYNIQEYQVGWKTCRRVACKNTSGVYICNDAKAIVRVTGTRINTLGTIPQDNCCHQGPADNVTRKVGHGISGQKFTGTGFNVIIAYANCNKGESEYFPKMGPEDNPWGPNLQCYTEFYGLSPSQTNGEVQVKKRERDRSSVQVVEKREPVPEPEWDLVDDGTGVMDLVEKENAPMMRKRAEERSALMKKREAEADAEKMKEKKKRETNEMGGDADEVKKRAEKKFEA